MTHKYIKNLDRNIQAAPPERVVIPTVTPASEAPIDLHDEVQMEESENYEDECGNECSSVSADFKYGTAKARRNSTDNYQNGSQCGMSHWTKEEVR